LKVIELDYVAPPRPNKNVGNLSWNRREISCGLLWLWLWKIRLPSTWGNTANSWSKTGLYHQFQSSIELRTLKSTFMSYTTIWTLPLTKGTAHCCVSPF